MGELNKKALKAGLSQLADSGTDRWDDIRGRLTPPQATPSRWSRNSLPLRLAAAACCLVLVALAGTALWQSGLMSTEKGSAAPPTNDSMPDKNKMEMLTDSVNDSEAESDSSAVENQSAHITLDLLVVAELTPPTAQVRSALQNSLAALTKGATAVRTGAVCYAATVTAHPFAQGTAHTAALLSGAGEKTTAPAVAAAIHSAVSAYTWREQALKVLVLAADHLPADTAALQQALSVAKSQGIRLVPVITEETDVEAVRTLQSMAQATGGTCITAGESISLIALLK